MKEYKSIFRSEQYQRLEKMCVSGKILDVAGSKKSGYHELLNENTEIYTININPDYGCDMIVDIEKPFPLANEIYDNALALNVLEHVFEFQNVFNEVFRVLKPGGMFIFTTPFIFHIHGSPDDYFRYTESALLRACKLSGFTTVKIETIGFGLFSIIFQTLFEKIKNNFIKNSLQNICVFLDKYLLKVSQKYELLNKTIPLGYFVVAKK